MLLGRGFTFQQDNDPKHTAQIVKKYFQNKEKDGTLRLLDWPSKSPDLNPIEHAWKILDDKLRDRNPQNEEQLFDSLKESWAKIDEKILGNLVDSMGRRCQAVIANKGYPTKY